MSKQLSQKKRLEIANVCYANVSSEFAMFNNPKYRGPNFTWEWWVTHCGKNADLWMSIHDVKGDKALIDSVAKEYSLEIATKLVDHLTS